MSQAISGGQARSLVASFLVDTPWDEIPMDVQPFIEMPAEKRGQAFAAFIRNNFSLIIGELKSLAIDRSKPFNPTKFIGSGVTIWRGPAIGAGLEGKEEQTCQSLDMTEIFLTNLRFEHMLQEGESTITGEEKLKRHLADKYILLDAKGDESLYEEPGQVTLEWIYRTFGVTWVEFPGTTLRVSDGRRCFLYLYRDGDGRWNRNYNWLDNERDAQNVSVVFATLFISLPLWWESFVL